MTETITVGEILELPSDDPKAVAFHAMLTERAAKASSGPFLTVDELRARSEARQDAYEAGRTAKGECS
jgi:hypothetical protein